MTFTGAVSSGFKNYFNFSGRASRSEYWYWVLFILIISIVFTALTLTVPPAFAGIIAIIDFVFRLLTLIPGLSIAVRRLHDTDHRGWWFFIIFTIIGMIPLFIWMVSKGTSGDNRFGPDPLADNDTGDFAVETEDTSE